MSSRPPPDALTLDEMLAGADDPEHEEGWSDLVRSADAALAWRSAIASRGRIDRLARWLRRAPWLSAPLQRLNAVRRRRLSSEATVHLDYPDAVLAAALALAEGEGARPVTLTWGDLTELALPIGERVCLLVDGDSAVEFRYEHGEASGPLPTGAWELKSDEAPVLLTAQAGEAVAGLLLVEE